MSEGFLDRDDLPRELKEQIAEADAKAAANGLSPEALAVVARLVALDPIRYDQCREAEAEQLGIRVSTLDKAVSKARGEGGNEPAAPGQGRPLDLPEPEAWTEPVNGAELLDELADTLGRHVVMSDEARDGTALWAAWTWSVDRFDIAPKLLIKSPEKRCGKTTLLDFLLGTVCRPLSAASITAAAMFRTIETAKPTLLIDEADTFMRENEELRGIVNSGHRKSQAFVIRCIGEDHEPRQFSTWCAMAIAGIGKQHGTIEDRSVVVTLKRKLPSEKVERFDDAARERLAVLARKLVRWSADHGEALIGARPEIPPELHDRAADNWRPLLAIADAAGGDWPKRGCDAARKLSGSVDADTLRVMLLADIKALFAAPPKAERLGSTFICAELAKLDHRPWPELSNRKPITTTKLAALLSSFEITPHSDGEFRGYKRAAFEDAWTRYLPDAAGPSPSDPPVNPSTRQKSSNGAAFGVSQPVSREKPPDGSKGAENPTTARVPDGLTGCEPGACKDRMSSTFVPTDDWRDVPDGAVLPPGCHIRVNVATRTTQARRAATREHDTARECAEPASGPGIRRVQI